MQRSKRFAGGYIELKTGREGPGHDPYGYQEYSISRKNGDEATLHFGLGVWLEVNKKRQNDFEVSVPELVERFEKICDISLRTFERAIYANRPCCKKPRPKLVAGYPGETLTICDNCGNWVNYSFSEAAII